MTMLQADILTWAQTYTGPKFHALLCDPPYHLTSGNMGVDWSAFGAQPDNPRKGATGNGQTNDKGRASKGFMGKTWDGGDIAFRPSTWAAIAQHLYPGAWGMVFASSRGWHRLAVAIEDAGLIIQPTIFGWAYGSGFPKATNISAQLDDRAFRAWLDDHPVEQAQLETLRQQARTAPKAQRVTALRAYQQARKHIKAAAGFAPVAGNKKQTGAKFKLTEAIMDNGGFNAGDRESFDVHGPATDMAAHWAGHRYGGQVLKPALEPIIVFQKPYDGSPVDNITSTGAGALWIDGGRLPTDPSVDDPRLSGKGSWSTKNAAKHVYEGGYAGADVGSHAAGRWPANLVLIHAPECERIGQRRVRSDGGTNGINKNTVYSDATPHAFYNYADADGYETIDAWQCIPSCPVARLGAQSGESDAKQAPRGAVNVGTFGGTAGGVYSARDWKDDHATRGHDDSGTAARYFYAADWMLDRLEAADPVAYFPKASTAEREAGLDPRQTAMMRLLDDEDYTENEPWVNQGQSQATRAASDTLQTKATTESGMMADSSLPMLCDGCRRMGQSPKAIKSTTKTATNKTTGSKTSNSSTRSRISESTPAASCATMDGTSRALCAVCSNPLPQSTGTLLAGDGHNTASVEHVISDPLSEASNNGAFQTTTINDGRQIPIDNAYQRGETTRRNSHPTIKPLSLSRYLATLLLPPAAYGPRRLLIPFAGAGSEAIGAMLAGWEEITGVELEAEHVAIANARISYWKQRAWELSDPDRKPTVTAASPVPAGQLDMFMEDSHDRS